MKTNKYIISIFAIFVLVFVSCKNSFTNNGFEKESGNNDIPQKTAKLYFNVNGQSARSIFPDTSLDNFCNFVLTGKLGDSEAVTSLGSWKSIQALLRASVDISAGFWNLTLTATKDQINFTSNTQIEVLEGQNVTASFILVAADTNNGIANITLRFPEKSEISMVEWEFREVRQSSYLYGWSNSIYGEYPEEDNPYYETHESIQTLTNTSYSIQTELPAGKYIFNCEFATEIGMPIGEYNDYIVIQPGLESKLDYTIDYFEFTGITQAVSTEQGMLLTVDIPKGVERIAIMRINDYTRLLQAMEEYEDAYHDNPDTSLEPPDLLANMTIINKQFDARTTSSTTIQLLDSYGFEAGNELTYAVYFDMNSMGSVIKTFTASYDGIPIPEFITYPEFATESNAQGITSKISITNNPVVDWKGHEVTGGYKVILNDESMQETLYPECAVDSITKEYVIADGSLKPGQRSYTGYRFGLDSNDWSYSLYLNTKNLSGAQLPPVLQGPSPAQATDDGINIFLYLYEADVGEMTVLRSTSLAGPWNIIEDEIRYDYDGQWYLDYTDKYDLVAGTTYYYKVVDYRGKPYGGEYFSATATVTKGPWAQIVTQPLLAVSDTAIATFTPGTFQFADSDDVNRIKTVYEFTEESNPGNYLRIEYNHYLSEKYSDYCEGYYSVENYGDFSPWIWGEINSMNLYKFDVDNKKYVFSSAYINFYNTNYNMIKQIDFTPAQGYCPAEIQIPNKKLGLSLVPTADGIVINLSNLPEGLANLSIHSAEMYGPENGYYFNENRYYNFDSNISSGTMTFTDKYVNNQKLYYYKVTARKDGEDGSYLSDVVSVTATGGSGEIGISVTPECTFDSTNNTVTYTQAAQLTAQDNFPDGTNYNIQFNYFLDASTNGYFYYSGVNPDYPVSFECWNIQGTYTPYNAYIHIYFPDYTYHMDNVSIPPNSTLPQQVVVQ